MSKRQNVKPFAALRNASPAPAVATLTDAEATRWRGAVRARQDAARLAELAAARARVAIGDAAEVEIAIAREMGAKYGFDPDRRWMLTDEGQVVEPPPQEPGQ